MDKRICHAHGARDCVEGYGDLCRVTFHDGTTREVTLCEPCIGYFSTWCKVERIATTPEWIKRGNFARDLTARIFRAAA